MSQYPNNKLSFQINPAPRREKDDFLTSRAISLLYFPCPLAGNVCHSVVSIHLNAIGRAPVSPCPHTKGTTAPSSQCGYWRHGRRHRTRTPPLFTQPRRPHDLCTAPHHLSCSCLVSPLKQPLTSIKLKRHSLPATSILRSTSYLNVHGYKRRGN